MRNIGIDLSSGKLNSKLLGVKVSTLNNELFCRTIRKEQDDDYFGSRRGYSSNLVYAIPVKSDEEESNNQGSANIVINLLMQLKAIAGNQNNIFKSGGMIKQQIIRQLEYQSSNMLSNKIKKEIRSISNILKENVVDNKAFSRTIDVVASDIKKKV